MNLMSAPQSTWCAGSYPCFRARCASGLRAVDAKNRPIRTLVANMNEAPRRTVRRSAEGALMTREFGLNRN
jgi:hypothetical protein